jgi:tight adherence protein B
MFSFISIGALVTVVFLIMGVYGLFFYSRAGALDRLKKYTAYEETYNETHGAKKDAQRRHLAKLLGVFAKFLPHSIYLKKRKKKLAQAAVLMKPEEFLGVSLISAASLAFLFYLLSNSMIIALILLPVGFIVPDLIIESKKSRRMAKISSQLPEALGIISNGLRAGFSFTQAMGVVISEISGPICEEFSKVLRENSLGKPLEEALTNMSDRTDDEDLDMFVTALIIQRQVGGNLAEVLDTISDTIRERVRIKGEIKTLTAQGKMSGIIVSLLPFGLAIALSIINPGYLTVLFMTFIGKLMIAVGVILQLIGIFVLTRLVDIKV